MQRRLLITMGVFFCSLLLIGGVVAVVKTDDEPPKDDVPVATPADFPLSCIQGVHFWAQDVANDNWGPDPGSREPAALVAALRQRRLTDPVRTVYDAAYQTRTTQPYPDREAGTALAVGLINDQPAWCDLITRLEGREATATSVTVHEMCGPYESLGMKDENRQIPEVYVVHPNRCFDVLDFSYADGSHDWYKINCGLQPVDKSFPGVPTEKGVRKPIPQPKPTPDRPTTTRPGDRPTTTQPGEVTTTAPGKCASQTGPLCGSPDSGPDLIHPQDNPPELVAATPGYTPGNAEVIVPTQTPVPGANPYTPTPHGSVGTGAGGQTPVGQTDTPSGPVNGGTIGASNPDRTNVSDQTNTTPVVGEP